MKSDYEFYHDGVVGMRWGKHLAGTDYWKKKNKNGITALKEMAEGPILIEVKVKKGNRKDLGRPTTTPIQNKEALMSFLSK